MLVIAPKCYLVLAFERANSESRRTPVLFEGVQRCEGVQGMSLMPAERQQEILRLAVSSRVVKVSSLAEDLGVHEMTIRRDLDDLAKRGLLERVRGGARIAGEAAREKPYRSRSTANVRQKRSIAEAALRLIEEGDTVAFDASTTSLTLVRLLAGRRINAIVVSLDAANALAELEVPFILLGGIFHPPARSFTGLQVERQLERLHPDKVFFSARGYTLGAGFTDAHLAEVEIKEQLIAAAGRAFALIDSSKFGKEALGTIVGLERVDLFVTDQNPPEEYRQAFDAAGVGLVVAEDSERGSR